MLNHPKFLVVDDDVITRKIVARGLLDLEPEIVVEVDDGLEAQAALRRQSFDVVITDVLMPNMDGRELMAWAREHCPGPMWIVLSSLDTFDAAVDAMRYGAFDFLPKPPEIHHVRIAVRNAIDHLDLTREQDRLHTEVERSNVLLSEKVHQLEELCRMLEDQAEVIHGDLERAEVIQRTLLPQTPPQLNGWNVGTLYRPGSNVGGDFYDIARLDERHVALVVADASGHGVAAAMLSVLFKNHLQMQDRVTGAPLSPSVVLQQLNRRLRTDVNTPGMFLTAVYVLLDTEDGRVTLASAGHPPCIWGRQCGSAQPIARSGPALCLVDDADYEDVTADLDQGDRLLLYTDGLLGRTDAGITTARLADLVMTGAEGSGLLCTLESEALGADDVDRDDLTAIVLERRDGVSQFDAGIRPQKSDPTTLQADPVTMCSGQVDDEGFLTVQGTGTWTRSAVFFESARSLLQSCRSLTIDLSGCSYLDSTFLGTLHEIVKLDTEAVSIQGVPPQIRDAFDELSMSAVLDCIVEEPQPLAADMKPLAQVDQDETRQYARMLRAHETLAALSEYNSQQFQDVIDSLRTELGSNTSS